VAAATLTSLPVPLPSCNFYDISFACRAQRQQRVEEAEAERQRRRRQKEIKHNGVEGKVVVEEVVGRRCGGCHFSMHTELLTIWRLASPYFVAGHAPSSQPPNPQKNLLRLWPPSLAFGLISELGEIGGLEDWGALEGLKSPEQGYSRLDLLLAAQNLWHTFDR